MIQRGERQLGGDGSRELPADAAARPSVPNIGLEVVDVRDIADVHIRAMRSEAAANQRFLATAEGRLFALLCQFGQLLVGIAVRLAHGVKLSEQALGCDGPITLIDPHF